MRTRAKDAARAVLFTASFVALGAGTAAFSGSAFADTTSGNDSVLGGNQVNAPISAPVNACGNSLAVFGTAGAGCEGGAVVKEKGSGGGDSTSGNGSVLGGNQVKAPISAPINVCGNAAAAFGDAGAGCEGGAKVKSPHDDGYGGDEGHGGYRTAQQATGSPAAMGLPSVPGITKAQALSGLPSFPKSPAADPAELSKLPDLPKLPAGSDVERSPVPSKVHPAAASEPISGGMESSAIYVMTVGALMAGASGAMTFARRLRFARR
jgi:hypothetical protein